MDAVVSRDRRGAAQPTSEVIDSTTYPWNHDCPIETEVGAGSRNHDARFERSSITAAAPDRWMIVLTSDPRDHDTDS
jgi:hypothetical protein